MSPTSHNILSNIIIKHLSIISSNLFRNSYLSTTNTLDLKLGQKINQPIMPAVPNTSQVVPGAPVSIVLKADQPTGREVQGTVQNVLTSGNHPRGIKVRLTDGRIGRVQRMHTGEIPPQEPSAAPSASHTSASRNTRPPRQRDMQRSKFQARDIRLDEDGEAPAEEIDLFAYVKPAKQKKRGGAKVKEPVEEEEVVKEAAATASCPVCGNFEGDEVAVAHHVESHFA
jgi:uncharacterized repeat protein (TIGR03833 family)